MANHPDLLATPADISRLAEQLGRADVIAFDTEFIRENTFYPVVEIIQVATAQDSWLVDARAFRKPEARPGLKPLLDVFTAPGILKIVHAAQGDQECLVTAYGVAATPCIDTAIAASLCGFGDGIGLGSLLKAVLGVTVKKGHARTDWTVRPLPPQLVEYAHADVEHLVETARRLFEKLDKLGRRAWAMELTAKYEDHSLYEPDPEVLAQRLAKGGKLDRRGYAALVELMKWREQRVRQLNLPRRWVADDSVLVDLARVRPKDVGHLSAFRGLNKGEIRNSGEAILSAVRSAADAQDVALPHSPRPDIPSESENQVLDLLRAYIGILADRHEIAARHIATSSQLLPILRAGGPDAAGFVKSGALSEGAALLVGEELVAFLAGRRALSIERNRVKIVEVRS